MDKQKMLMLGAGAVGVVGLIMIARGRSSDVAEESGGTYATPALMYTPSSIAGSYDTYDAGVVDASQPLTTQSISDIVAGMISSTNEAELAKYDASIQNRQSTVISNIVRKFGPGSSATLTHDSEGGITITSTPGAKSKLEERLKKRLVTTRTSLYAEKVANTTSPALKAKLKSNLMKEIGNIWSM